MAVPPPPLPAAVTRLLATAPLVGFSGSRAPTVGIVAWLEAVLATLPAEVPVVVGSHPNDKGSVDQRVRAALLSGDTDHRLRVFPAENMTKGALVHRSADLAEHVATAGGLLVAFPKETWPASLVPQTTRQKAFMGNGGTWGTTALAAGRGAAVLVRVPTYGSPAGWDAIFLGEGWWLVGATALPWVGPLPRADLFDGLDALPRSAESPSTVMVDEATFDRILQAAAAAYPQIPLLTLRATMKSFVKPGPIMGRHMLHDEDRRLLLRTFDAIIAGTTTAPSWEAYERQRAKAGGSSAGGKGKAAPAAPGASYDFDAAA